MLPPLAKSSVFTLVIGIFAVSGLLLLPGFIPLNGEEGSPWLAFIGRFHIVLLHLPIGCLILITFLEIAALKMRALELRALIQKGWYFVAACALLTVTLGITLASSEGYSGNMVTDHMWMAIATSIAIVLCGVLYHFNRTHPHRFITYSYRTSMLAALVAVTITGHLGGNLVQGEDYLYAKLPQSLQLKLGLVEPVIAPSFDTPIYASFVEPVFASKCASCHSDAKVKGQFKLDSLANLLKGGKSGKAAILPGNAMDSEVVHRITLPSSDKKAMPPDGRTPLDEEQIQIINWWVRIGAPADASVNDLSLEQVPANIESILVAMIDKHHLTHGPQVTYASLDQSLLQQTLARLTAQYGIKVTSVSQNPRDGLHISAFNFRKALDADAWQSMQPLAPFIRSVDFARIELTQSSIVGLSSFAELEELKLTSTPLTGLSLTPLTSLKKLTILNLFETGIDDASVDALAKLRSLKQLYLANTNISPQGITALQRELRRANIIVHVQGEVAPLNSASTNNTTEKS